MTATAPAGRLACITRVLEVWSAAQLSRLVAAPARAALALIALVLALDLAGSVLLPPLDRTEVIYAQTTKQMLEAGGPGTWTAPAFQAEPKFEKPLAVLWLQGLSAAATGQVDQIRGYRIPSILGTILAVLLTWLGARWLFDARIAFVGAALLATMLVVTVQATLAMPEALMLGATCAALFAMGRAYISGSDSGAGRGNALVFWIALGLGFLVNVVTIPLIAVLTALALIAWDRGNAGWLKRLVSLPGILLFLILAALWPLAFWTGGTLDDALAQWREEGVHLLLGPQDMKWRVMPGLFVVFLLLGMFPAGLFLGPAVLTSWRERTSPAIRFLIAWVLPYLLFLELFTRKTPLYMVQTMLPPLAVLFAIWVTLAVVLGLTALVLGLIATKAMLDGHRLAAASALVAMAVAINNLAIPVTFAGLRPMWVSTEILAAAQALRPCIPGHVVIAGYTEPSAVFELGGETVRTTKATEAAEAWRNLGGIAVIGAAQKAAFSERARELGLNSATAVGCIAAYDFIKSCSHRFTVFAAQAGPVATKCALPARFRCENVAEKPMLGRMCKLDVRQWLGALAQPLRCHHRACSEDPGAGN
jgi:4-amino-4-deoxy-L-arabinose transferase-like glycosyltransferase